MSDFEDRLQSAIERGQRQGAAADDLQQKQQMSEQELRQRHTDFRLKLSDHIEQGLKRLPEHFPGFAFETIYGDRGWGGALYRDDLTTERVSGRGGSFYSRLEITVRPMTKYNLVEIAVKGTVQNKEVVSKNYFEEIQEAVLENFTAVVDNWIVLYAEKYAAV